MTRKLTKAKAEAALRAIRRQFAAHTAVTGGPTLVKDYEFATTLRADYAIVWEEGPFEWTYDAFRPHVDQEFGVRRDGATRPAGVFAEPITSYALGLYRDDTLPAVHPVTWAEIDEADAARKALRERAAADEGPKGLMGFVYRNGRGDCSNGGLSSRADTVVVVGPGIPRIFAPTEDMPAVELAQTVPGYTVARPLGRGDVWWMDGGTFVYSSDSRWPTKAPIPLHDRTESAVMSARLSQ